MQQRTQPFLNFWRLKSRRGLIAYPVRDNVGAAAARATCQAPAEEVPFSIAQNNIQHSPHKANFDCCVRSPIHTHICMPAPPTKQHIYNEIDKAGINSNNAVIIPRIGFENIQDCGQRNGREIIAKTDRCNAVKRHFHIIREKIAQG